MAMRGSAAATMTGGVLLLLSALAHGLLGWPAVRAELTGAGVGPKLLPGMAIGWLFGSFSMAIFGIIVFWSGRSWWRGRAVWSVPACVIGAGYGLFGVAALIFNGGGPHFIGFILIGVIVVAGAVSSGAARAR
jgi:hypothetical protein